MNFRINDRDGPSRIGEIKINNQKIISPNILFLHTKRFKSPNFSDILITNTEEKTKKPYFKTIKNILIDNKLKDKKKDFFLLEEKDIFTLEYAYQIFRKPKKFLKTIIKNKEELGSQKIMYTPSIAEPINLSLLVYLGTDLFDSTRAIISARNKTMFFVDGNKKTVDLDENPCVCQTCKNKKPKDMTFEEILEHNYRILYSEIKNIRNHIKNKNLRGLVEKRVKTDPHLTTVLRNLDKDNYSYLEEKTPVSSKNNISATSIESINRPEIKRFQKRTISRYKKPKHTKILLLLPCSAKKPYSFSKSHSFFKRAIFSSDNQYVVHEVIITSPLGVVPRELELIYPASNYDIPVTGYWFEDEKKMIRNYLKMYLKENKYDFIISHLPEEINDFINDIVKIDISTCIKHPTSNESTDKLKNVLIKETKKFEKLKKSERLKEDVEAFLSYQFGKKIAKKLIYNTSIKGRYPYLKIMKENVQLGMLVKEKGLVSLTLEGAKILFEEKKNLVKIYDDFELKGSIFAPGIKNADINIRIGDEVAVIRANQLVGIGSALMSGSQMKELTYGEAIKMRHLKKD